jgi:hypothetical protein
VAISPAAIATEGFLDSPLSVSVIGHLTLGGETPPSVGGGGGGRRPWYRPGRLERYKSPIVALDELKEQLRSRRLREDEEIVAIILAAVRVIE